jgi:hypothetical protein
MHPVVERLRIALVFTMVLFAGGNVLVGRVLAAEPAPSARWCVAAAYRQFDFWVGDWDVFDVGSSIPVAHARIDPILDGCVLREDYQGTDGQKGQSFTIYDAARRVWHQSWVTNRGELLEIEGKIENGEIILSGEDRAAGSLVRGTWKPQNGNVRETAVTSTDGGNTWKPWFDLVFRRKASAVGDAHTSETTERPWQLSTSNIKPQLRRMMPPPWKLFWRMILPLCLVPARSIPRRICSRKRAAAACAMHAKTTPSRQCPFGAIPR